MDIGLFKTFAEARAIGLLVGVERYKDREAGEQKSAAVRTFPIFALLGAVCGLLGETTFMIVTFAGLAGAWILARFGKTKFEEPPWSFCCRIPTRSRPRSSSGCFSSWSFSWRRSRTVLLGEEGIYLASAITGLGDASAIPLSVAGFVSREALLVPSASAVILIAVTMNALLKSILALTSGNRSFAL